MPDRKSDLEDPASVLADQLRVEPLLDPVIDALGHDPRSRYVEHFWLSILGPSTCWLLRRIANRFDEEPEGFTMQFQATADALGLGTRGGRNSPFLRALDRCEQFGLAQRTSTTFFVRRRLPPLTQGQIKRLPPELRAFHDQIRAESIREPLATERAHQARRLALTMLELGEDAAATERQLQQWRFDPDVCRQAAAWAEQRHRDALAAVGGEAA